MERGAGCSNCSIDFALTTVSNDKTVEISKEAYNSDNELISEDFTTEYEFKITDINGSSFVGDERKYTIGSQEFTLDDDGILKLKNGEKARFDNWSDAGKYKTVAKIKKNSATLTYSNNPETIATETVSSTSCLI